MFRRALCYSAGALLIISGIIVWTGCEPAVVPDPGGRPIPPDLLEPGPIVFATGSVARGTDGDGGGNGETFEVEIGSELSELVLEPNGSVMLRAFAEGGQAPLAFVWRQLSGPAATIDSPRQRQVTVSVSGAGIYEIAVLVVDADGRQGGDVVTLRVSAGPAALVRRLYWTNGPDEIQRIDLTETGIEDLVGKQDAPFDIALDLVNEQIYWVTQQPSRIRRADLEGDNVRTIVSEPGSARGIAVDPIGEHLYWTELSQGQVLRSSLNGGGVRTLVDGAGSPEGIAIDGVNGKVYWVDRAAGQILRASLSGAGVETVVEGLTSPMRIALDLANGRMYWTNGFPGKVQRANLSGSGVRDVVTELSEPVGIAVDPFGGKIYWASQFPDLIERANLNGSNVETFISGLTYPAGVALEFRVIE